MKPTPEQKQFAEALIKAKGLTLESELKLVHTWRWYSNEKGLITVPTPLLEMLDGQMCFASTDAAMDALIRALSQCQRSPFVALIPPETQNGVS